MRIKKSPFVLYELNVYCSVQVPCIYRGPHLGLERGLERGKRRGGEGLGPGEKEESRLACVLWVAC